MDIEKLLESILKELTEGREVKLQIEEGYGISMRGVLNPGQVVTLSPVTDFHSINTGDIVLVKWKRGSYILHLVQEIKEDQFLIVNSAGKINGWVHGRDIIGKAINPELYNRR